MLRAGKWTDQLLAARQPDGLWGQFHTLSQPVGGKGITTEQALRRMWILGGTKDDEPVRAVLDRMVQSITGERAIDDYSEKTHDWPLFEKLMLAAWVRILDPQQPDALAVARWWGAIAEAAFADGQYNRARDIEAFAAQRGRRPKSGFETGFPMFYHAALLQGVLSPAAECAFFDYYLAKPDGMYYVYEKTLSRPPEMFASRAASRYLAALEVLAGYGCAREKLAFAVDWLLANRAAAGQWDFGSQANDGVYFPLSDNWRRAEARRADCTERVVRFLSKLDGRF